MSPDGQDFTCTSCHVTDRHEWAGSRYAVRASDPEGTGLPGQRRDVATCQSCHGNEPHAGNIRGIKLNDHTDVLACQSCHIPAYARGGVATKTVWDWSTAGRLDDNGNPVAEHGFTQSDGKHLHTYMSQKGDFDWGENVAPTYAWFNGQVEYTTGEQVIDPGDTVEINRISGSPDDGTSRIWPFKRMEGRQAYDAERNTLVYTHVWGPQSATAYWKHFEWGPAIQAGMQAAGLPYSGTYGFVDTHMYWPITHMVAPAEGALDCASCHAQEGRMQGLAGVFLPGTNPGSLTGRLGQSIVLMSLLGMLGHLGLRLFTRRSSQSGDPRHD